MDIISPLVAGARVLGASIIVSHKANDMGSWGFRELSIARALVIFR